jgi:hypothetical protein
MEERSGGSSIRKIKHQEDLIAIERAPSMKGPFFSRSSGDKNSETIN